MWPEMSSRTASARHARCRLTLCRFYSLLLRERSCCFAFFFFFPICSLTQALLCSNPGCPELTGHPPASASGCGARCRVKLLCQHCGSALSSFRAVEMSETGCTVPRSTSRSPAPHTLVCKSPGLSQSVLVLSAWCSASQPDRSRPSSRPRPGCSAPAGGQCPGPESLLLFLVTV